MTGVKMAAFDLDGTLLDHGALTREAILMLRWSSPRGGTGARCPSG